MLSDDVWFAVSVPVRFKGAGLGQGQGSVQASYFLVAKLL